METFWDELLTRIQWLRNLYTTRRITLHPGEGLAKSLNEAEAVAKGVVKSGPTSDEDVMEAIRACHVVWGLYDSVKACIGAGLDVTQHLAQIATGTTDYGIPAKPLLNKTIFFKDFETELFVAASLARAGLHVEFLAEANDPRGEMRVGDILIEVKHPDSTKRQHSLMRKFNGELRKSDSVGVFVNALEDAFSLATPSAFQSVEEFNRWQNGKDDEIERFGLGGVFRAATLPRIAALVQTSSNVEVIGNETRFVRRSNSLIFDKREYASGILEQVERIASVFNPDPQRYSLIRNLVAGLRRRE